MSSSLAALGLSPSAYLFLILGLVPAYFVCLCIYRVWLHPLAKFPGPPLAKVTNLYAAYHAWKGDLHIDMWKSHEKYGNYVRYAPGRVMFNTNTGLKEIYGYSKNYQKSANYGAMVHRAPNTLTLIDKKAHGRKRRILSQGLSEAALRSYQPTILTHIRKLCAQLEGESEMLKSDYESSKWSIAQNMGRWANYLTFDIMSDVIFGEGFGLLENPHNREVVQCIEDSNVRTGVLVQAPEVATCRIDRRLFPNAILGRNKFIRFVNGLLKRRMQVQPLKRHDVFSGLLDAKDPETGDGLAPAEIGAESTTMIIAGSDTSSTSIASTLFYLSRHPKVYAKANEEVRAAFSGPDDVGLGATLNSCTYLRACIDESLRMSPPAGSALWREVCADGVTIDGHSMPKGYDVGTCIYAIHHNEAYYPEPFAYLPERWLQEGTSDGKSEAVVLARSAFSPFSIGPRSCLGKGLANTELMLTMAFILSKFDFRIAPGAEEVGGGKSDGEYGRHREKEYQMRDHITMVKDGPILQFSRRQVDL
ncbi:hypothetical protein AJ80_03711 [Polytolypa hystricis UAMH7299]|uniref:Uncharacterized protein n=1 Tax=Polytolypa hystricis (strain UAMH7299) TaxID=1447883 RepID=A0A2B7YGA2_POLH7|nr:hypothetical protein AJ80_03711 [Polytolypa hystricis UAMH7299]